MPGHKPGWFSAGLSAGGETADVERSNRQLGVLVGIFVIKILKGNHLLGLDGEIRAEPRVLCPPSKRGAALTSGRGGVGGV